MGLPLPLMIGLGAATGALTNKNPLKGALLGGALGGVGGMFGPAASGAAGTSAVGSAQAAGLGKGISLLDTGLGTALVPSSVVPSGAGISLGAGLPTGMGITLPTGVGDALLAGNIGTVGGLGAFDTLSKYAREYATPQNLLGVAQLATPTNQAPLQNIGSGQISRSQVPEYVPFNVGEVQTWKKRGQA